MLEEITHDPLDTTGHRGDRPPAIPRFSQRFDPFTTCDGHRVTPEIEVNRLGREYPQVDNQRVASASSDLLGEEPGFLTLCVKGPGTATVGVATLSLGNHQTESPHCFLALTADDADDSIQSRKGAVKVFEPFPDPLRVACQRASDFVDPYQYDLRGKPAFACEGFPMALAHVSRIANTSYLKRQTVIEIFDCTGGQQVIERC